MKRVTLLFATVAATWISSSGPASAACYRFQDETSYCDNYTNVPGLGIALGKVVERGTTSTYYSTGKTFVQYLNGKTRIGKWSNGVTSLPGTGTWSGTLGR